jgi:hypothetical protein
LAGTIISAKGRRADRAWKKTSDKVKEGAEAVKDKAEEVGQGVKKTVY